MSNYSSTAAERPRQLPEQLGTAERGGRGARAFLESGAGPGHPTFTFLGWLSP